MMHLVGVNFLAHYYFDRKEDPHYNLGLLFPDLLRNFIKRAKIPFHTLQTGTLPLEIQQLVSGCLQHVESDKRFHNWRGFVYWNDWLLERIRSQPNIVIEKDWFVAHIFSELLMDKIILNEHPSIADEMYASFEHVNMEEVLRFIRLQGIEHDERFEHGFVRFMESKYLNHYARNEGVIFALGKISAKMGLPEATKDEQNFLHELADELTPIMKPMIDELQRILK
jgi:hypothetical protein